MSPKYFQREIAGRDRWMISYLDVLTILLIFFVALAAQNFQKPQAALAAPPAPAPVVIPAKIDPLPEPQQTLLEAQKRLADHGLDMRMEPRGLVISLPQAILFSSGDDRVTSDALPIVSRIADVLRDIPNEVSLIGHADAVPIHNRYFKNNWDLSAARGLRLLELLSRKYGIAEARLSVASYGPYRPNGPNDTPDGRARNRRVEIVILGEPAAQ
jgi:chemotaxis protein MotB